MKHLLFLLILLSISAVSFAQNKPLSPKDSSRVVITMDNGAIYYGKIVDQNEKEVLLIQNDQTFTLSVVNIQEIDSSQHIRNVRVTLKDGSERKGLLLKETEKEVVLQNENGQLFLERDQVDRVETDYQREYIRIQMKDGTVYQGYRRVDKKEPNVVYTSNGKVVYDPSQVKEIQIIDESKAGYYEHPLSTRYIITPTAIPMRKGEGYWSSQLLLVNSYYHGVTKNISIGGGFEIITTLFALSPTPFANLKASFSASENFHYGVGVFGGTFFGQVFGENIYYALPYGMVTIGDRNSNLTFGGGAGFINRETASYYSVSGTLRLSPKFGLVSNNYLVIDNQEGFGEFLSAQGIRIIGKSITLDLALAFTRGTLESGIVLPFLGFSFYL